MIQKLVNELLESQLVRKQTAVNYYEAKKARGQCTAANKCKSKPVPFHTMCSDHLRKAALASNNRHRRKKY